MSNWRQHVKSTQQQHKCNFKDALTLASKTWKQQNGAGVGASSMRVGVADDNDAHDEIWRQLSQAQEIIEGLLAIINTYIDGNIQMPTERLRTRLTAACNTMMNTLHDARRYHFGSSDLYPFRETYRRGEATLRRLR